MFTDGIDYEITQGEVKYLREFTAQEKAELAKLLHNRQVKIDANIEITGRYSYHDQINAMMATITNPTPSNLLNINTMKEWIDERRAHYNSLLQ